MTLVDPVSSVTLSLRCVGKVRMVSSDRWKIPKGTAKKSVYDYILFADKLRLGCRGFALSDSYCARFYFKMPDSWSKEKKEEMRGKAHQNKPDIDNCIKSIQDILRPGDDQKIYSVSAMKIWAGSDFIVIENKI